MCIDLCYSPSWVLNPPSSIVRTAKLSNFVSIYSKHYLNIHSGRMRLCLKSSSRLVLVVRNFWRRTPPLGMSIWTRPTPTTTSLSLLEASGWSLSSHRPSTSATWPPPQGKVLWPSRGWAGRVRGDVIAYIVAEILPQYPPRDRLQPGRGQPGPDWQVRCKV